MKVSVPWSPFTHQVYAITWLRHGQENSMLEYNTSFSIFEDGGLSDIYEHDCHILEAELDDFCLMPKSFDDRFFVLMWRPLAEAGIWSDLREFDKSAMSRFENLRTEYGHISTSIS